MIFFWLILLAVLYVVAAVAVGKVCAINSRWERSVDQTPSGPGDNPSPGSAEKVVPPPHANPTERSRKDEEQPDPT